MSESINLIQTRERIDKGKNIYKIGISVQEVNNTMYRYTKNSILHFHSSFKDQLDAKTYLLNSFKRKFKQYNSKKDRDRDGYDYFLGDLLEMKKEINNYSIIEAAILKPKPSYRIYNKITPERITNAVNKLSKLLLTRHCIKIESRVHYNEQISEICYNIGIVNFIIKNNMDIILIYNNKTDMDDFWRMVNYYQNLLPELITVYHNLRQINVFAIDLESIESIRTEDIPRNLLRPGDKDSGNKQIRINTNVRDVFPNYREDIAFGGTKKLFKITHDIYNKERLHIIYEIDAGGNINPNWINYNNHPYTIDFHFQLILNGDIEYHVIYDLKDPELQEKIYYHRNKYDIIGDEVLIVDYLYKDNRVLNNLVLNIDHKENTIIMLNGKIYLKSYLNKYLPRYVEIKSEVYVLHFRELGLIKREIIPFEDYYDWTRTERVKEFQDKTKDLKCFNMSKETKRLLRYLSVI